MTVSPTLVALTDFSPGATRACRRAALLAHDRHATLHLLHVMPARALDALDHLIPDNAAALRTMAREGAEQTLQQLADALVPLAQQAPMAVLGDGKLIPALLAESVRLAADLIVLGAQGHSALSSLLLGTTTERLLHLTTTPTLVVKTVPESSYQRVLVPVDFSADSAAALRLAEQWFPHTGITVLHVADTEFTDIMVEWPDEASLVRYREEERQRAAEALETFVQATARQPLRCTPLLKTGQARRGILEAAEELQADLIVMGSQGRDFLERALLGSHTRHILAESRCDVLVSPHPR